MLRLATLVAACTLLWSLESVWPLRRGDGSRLRHAGPNVALTVLVFAMNLALSFVTAAVAGREGIGWWSWWAVIPLDLATYGAHVALHKSRLGWRVHRLHHSDTSVDVTTAFRQHPLETIWRVVCLLPVIALLRIPLAVVVLHQTLSALNAQLEHANVRVPERLDRAARLLFVTPNMHKIHHSSWQPQTDSNYANIFSIWDRLFGTHTRTAELSAIRYGLTAID